MLEKLSTEKRNDDTKNLDQLTISQILTIMNKEDSKVPLEVGKSIPEITSAVELTHKALSNGGRIIYMGAGTSGRFGFLDSAECPPTFGTSNNLVVGLIAGGDKAIKSAVEGAEDNGEFGVEDLMSIKLEKDDVVIGIAASGRTPYVIGGLKYARAIGAVTISIACNKNAAISNYSDVAIEVDCGAEILTGSTRLKAGTAQKLILNMISTATMVSIGKVYQNLMVDVNPTNEKLVDRARRIIIEATGVDYDTATAYLDKSNRSAKVAIVMILSNCSYKSAIEKLKDSDGFVRKAVMQ